MKTDVIKHRINTVTILCGLALIIFVLGISTVSARECLTGRPIDIINSTANPSCGMSSSGFDPNSNCFWFSKALREIFYTMDVAGTAIYESLATGFAIPLMACCFGIWLAFQVLRYVGPLYEQSASDFAMLIGHGIARLVVGWALIEWGAGPIFETFIGTVVIGAANIGTDIMMHVSSKLDPDNAIQSFDVAGWDGLSEVMKLHAAIAFNIKMATSSFMQIVGMGKVLVNFSFEDGLWCILPSVDPLWTGFVLMVAGAIMAFIIPFKFLDILFRLTLVYALLPLFIVAWVFPSTRKYTMKAWGIVMYAVCLMLIMSVIFALCSGMISGLLLGDSTTAAEDPKELYLIFRTDESCQDKNMLLIMLITVFIGIKTMGLGKQLAGHFSESNGGSDAEGLLNKVAGTVAGHASSALAAGGAEMAGSLANGMKDKMQAAGSRIGGAFGNILGGNFGAGFKALAPSLPPAMAAGMKSAKQFKSDRAALQSNPFSSYYTGDGNSYAGGTSDGNNTPAVAGSSGKSMLADIQSKIEAAKAAADLDKQIMDKLDFVNKDTLDKLDDAQKKTLLDAAHAISMAKAGMKEDGTKLEGGAAKHAKESGVYAEDVLRYTVNNELDKEGGAEKLTSLLVGVSAEESQATGEKARRGLIKTLNSQVNKSGGFDTFKENINAQFSGVYGKDGRKVMRDAVKAERQARYAPKPQAEAAKTEVGVATTTAEVSNSAGTTENAATVQENASKAQQNAAGAAQKTAGSTEETTNSSSVTEHPTTASNPGQSKVGVNDNAYAGIVQDEDSAEASQDALQESYNKRADARKKGSDVLEKENAIKAALRKEEEESKALQGEIEHLEIQTGKASLSDRAQKRLDNPKEGGFDILTDAPEEDFSGDTNAGTQNEDVLHAVDDKKKTGADIEDDDEQ